MNLKPELLKTHKCFNGLTQFWEHDSSSTKTKMRFSTFIPHGKVRGCLIWLSGLTCSEENFVAKAGAQRALASKQLMVICPDTSPRGLELPGEHESWDFGDGAGFYVDATTPGYADHYRMYSYVTHELYALVQNHFGFEDQISIFGHSMGGHGALVMALREPGKFKSVSAFAPIVNPVNCAWGKKAFSGYLGEDQSTWKKYDACELIREGKRHPQTIMVDQGTSDNFLAQQLLTANFSDVCDAKNQADPEKSRQLYNVRMQEGYDHSYYFIATFVTSHIEFHSEHFGT